MLTRQDDVQALVINLDRATARMAQFLADNTMPGMMFQRVAAVDGQNLDRDELVRTQHIHPDLRFSGPVLGCALSHIACWRHVAQGQQPVLICEDDAVFRHDFPVLHHHLGRMIEQADIVYWTCNFDMHVTCDMPGLGQTTLLFDKAVTETNEGLAAFQSQQSATILYRARRIWGTAAYTVTPRGAQRLLDLVLPLRHADRYCHLPDGIGRTTQLGFTSVGIDMDMGMTHIDQLDGWVAVPPVVVARNDKADSAIEAFRALAEPPRGLNHAL